MSATLQSRRHLFSAEEFLAMGNAGIFPPDKRLELIRGEIIDMASIGSPHATVVSRLTRLFNRITADVLVRPQAPLVLGKSSVPEPDIAVVKPSADEYFSAHPRASDALLVVEVADSSLGIDLNTKAPLYAEAGVTELWIVDIEHRAIHVYRDPAPAGYRTSWVARGSVTIQPLALTEVSLTPDSLFPRDGEMTASASPASED
jgi:Uma2 family endonuclease